MIRVADYVVSTLARDGIRHVFMVTGGGAMHINDAIGRCPDLEYVCCHHEQACAMAAASYYRLTNRLAAVNVTTGPGGTNAITGVFGAWVESLGMIVISGQVKFETTVRSAGLGLRQLGDQELDITKIVSPITKYAVMVTDPASIRFHLEKALHLAKSGRPGPVWLDIPMDVQSAMIDVGKLQGFVPEEDDFGRLTGNALKAAAGEIVRKLNFSERPVLLAGSGVRLANAADIFRELVNRWQIPVATGFNAHDLLAADDPCLVGRQGTIGDRAGNFAVQNADFLLVIGCRLTIRQVSYNWENFARVAFKVIVDVDPAELKKPTIAPDLPVVADAGELIDALLKTDAPGPRPHAHRRWLDWCLERKRRYPVVLAEYRSPEKPVNPYFFVEALFERLAKDDIVVTGDGTACIATFQAAALKAGQRLYSDGGCAPMGFDLPAAVGASVGSAGHRVICVAGDGSIQMNLQELQTIATHRMPVKIFVLNNNGYLSIRLTQAAFFPGNFVGCDPSSGVGIPDFEALARAYGIGYRSARKNHEVDAAIAAALESDGPQMTEIFVDPDQPFAPKTSSRRLPDGRMISAPLEDMFPFLDRNEFLENMIVPPVGE